MHKAKVFYSTTINDVQYNIGMYSNRFTAVADLRNVAVQERPFVDSLIRRIAVSTIMDTSNLIICPMGDGKLNFCYHDCQIGRFGYNPKTDDYDIQVLSNDDVDWYYCVDMKFCISQLSRWLAYTRSLVRFHRKYRPNW